MAELASKERRSPGTENKEGNQRGGSHDLTHSCLGRDARGWGGDNQSQEPRGLGIGLYVETGNEICG
jgi:hypothetical protein